MDEEWSSVVEQALQYASPLPVLEVTSTDTSGTETSHACISAVTMPHFNSFRNVQQNSSMLETHNNLNDSGDLQHNSATSLHPHSIGNDVISKDNNSNRCTQTFLDLVSVTEGKDHYDDVITSNNLPTDQTGTISHHTGSTISTSTNNDEAPSSTTTGTVPNTSSMCEPSIESERNSEPKVKKTRKRVRNPDPPPEPILPPCSVCDEKSSGYHYGANTCEACKGFFRRTLKKNEVNYKCKCKPDEKEQWKRGTVKNGCASCRYKRCVSVGMSKDAIKIGRYTLQHKTENINQVKSVEPVDKMIDAAMISESSPSSSSGIDISSPGDVTSPMMMFESTPSPSYLSTQDDVAPSPSKKDKIVCRQEIVTLKEVETMVAVITQAQTKMDFDDYRLPIEVIKQKQTEYLEKYNIKKELFGDMGLSKEEFSEFYKITGIDLDGRLQHVDGAFNFFERKISQVVAFAKSIPGFKQLSLNDQANLIKASRTESTLLGGFRALLRNFDMERRVLTTPWGKEIHMDELERIVPIHFILSKFKYARSVIDLKLTIQEESIIRAIVTMFSDRCKLEEPHKVDHIQEKLVACLQHLLNIRPGGAGSLFYKIFNLITNLRNFNENETEFTKSLLQEWPMLSTNKYQLLKEFLS